MLELYTMIACAFAFIWPSTNGALSIPSAGDLDRKARVRANSLLIYNVPRQFVYGNQTISRNPGPTAATSKLYNETLISQIAILASLQNPNATTALLTLQSLGPYKTRADFKRGYDALQSAGLIEIPYAFDNSDENFGNTRLGVRGFTLKLVNPGEWSDPLNSLSNSVICEQCNEQNIQAAISNHKVFSQDFSTVGQFTDPNTTNSKYVASVIGFFCNNITTGLLLPLAIKIVDTGLTYTKEDSAGEWQLAKMTLDAAEMNHQQMSHFYLSHLISVPIQVEMIRSMDKVHPIFALLDYHFLGNMGLEVLSGRTLLSPGTSYDQTFGFGALGSEFRIVAEFAENTLADDYPTKIENSGRMYLPNHTYVKYGQIYYSSILDFVTAFVKSYYLSEEDIQCDPELQTWAARASAVKGINGFPPAFKGYDDLIKLVTNLIFRNSVEHHYMNGICTWASIAGPTSTSAIYNKPLPTKKGIDVDPFDYVIPSELFPLLSFLVIAFHRPIPLNTTALSAYSVSPFSNETLLVNAIEKYHQDMVALENKIDSLDPKDHYLDNLVRPSMMPHYSYT